MEDEHVILSVNDNGIMVEVPDKCQKCIIKFRDAFQTTNTDLNLKQFKTIIISSISKDSTDTIHTITDKYPSSIDIEFLWKGILKGSMNLSIPYDDLKLDKEKINEQHPIAAQMIEYLEDELISLGVKNPDIIKTIIIPDKDLIDFYVINNHDVHSHGTKYGYYHDMSKCYDNMGKCYHDDIDCIKATNMSLIINSMCGLNNKYIYGTHSRVAVESGLVTKLSNHMIEYKDDNNSPNGYKYMINKVFLDKKFDKKLTITKYYDGALVIDGVIFHKFDIYKKNQSQDLLNIPPSIFIPNINALLNTTFKICDFKYYDARSDIQLATIYIPYQCALMYYLEVKNNTLNVVTDGYIAFVGKKKLNNGTTPLLKQFKRMAVEASGGCLSGYPTSLSINEYKNYYYYSSNGLPFNFQFDNVKLYPI